MSIVAVVPVSNLASANATLEAQGFGPRNFSVAAYSGTVPAFAALHAWGPPAFATAVKSLPGVAVNEQPGDPAARTKALIESQGARWGDQAPALPTSGNAVAGTLYRYNETELWWCIQTFNRTTFPLPPATYPALIRRARIPGEALPWVQPLDQFDSYRLVNRFTGSADECLHTAKRWRTTIDFNVFEPGTLNSGWVEVDEQGNPIPEPEPPPPDEWPQWVPWDGNNANLYQVGAKVTFNGQRWIGTTPNNHWTPGVFGWDLQP